MHSTTDWTDGMADSARYDEPPADAMATSQAPPRTPRWVKITAIVALVFVLLLGAKLLIGGGDHGPGRHGIGNDAGSQSPPAAITEPGGAGGHTPPPGGHGP